MQSLGNPDVYAEGGTDKNAMTAEGARNSDCSNVGDGITNRDALAVQKMLLKLIDKLPENN